MLYIFNLNHCHSVSSPWSCETLPYWNDGEPNDWASNEDCGHIRTGSSWIAYHALKLLQCTGKLVLFNTFKPTIDFNGYDHHFCNLLGYIDIWSIQQIHSHCLDWSTAWNQQSKDGHPHLLLRAINQEFQGLIRYRICSCFSYNFFLDWAYLKLWLLEKI